MKTQVEKMLDKDVIRECTSPWSDSAILVPKKSENGKSKFMFFGDFRALNSVTNFDTYPLSVFEETTSNLHGSKYYSVLDCYSGFWQISIKEEQKERRAFQFHPSTTSSTNSPSVCRTAHRAFNG